MELAPIDPSVRHVWVRPQGQHGETLPGLVISWQRSLRRTVLASDWVALVALVPFGDSLLLEWVGAERLVPVRDPAPAELPTERSGAPAVRRTA